MFQIMTMSGDPANPKAFEQAQASVEQVTIRKVPGEVKPLGKLDHEIKSFQTSIRSKTVPELKDMLARQNVILNNKVLVSKLEDKGAKVKRKKEELEALIAQREQAADEAADMLKDLKINTDEMEWKHGGSMFKHLNLPTVNGNGALDSDDEEEEVGAKQPNVFRVLASRELPAKPATTWAVRSGDYVKGLASKVDDKTENTKDRFAPFKSPKSEELDAASKADIKLEPTDMTKKKKVELMPLPPSNYSQMKVKTIDLAESLELQKQGPR